MKNNLKLSLLFSCFLISPAMAADQLYYFGGGGEGSKTSTIFDYNIPNVKNITSAHQLDYKISFNGGHKNTEAQLKSTFPTNKVNNFTEKNFNNHLAKIEQQITRGEIKKNEKLLLIIDSHGGERNKETTHSISLANNKQVKDLNNLSGSDGISLDRLKKVVALAQEKGIKLGIVDFSCHSGATLDLIKSTDKNVCIISSTGPHHYGYAGSGVFADHFMKELARPNADLETAFVKARKNAIDVGYPMISTPVHKMIEKDFYGDLTQLLFYEREGKEGKLINHFRTNDFDCVSCTPIKLQAATNLRLKIAKLKLNGILEHTVADELTKEVDRYNQFQQGLIKEYNVLNIPLLSNKESFISPEINPDTKRPYINQQLTWYEIINSNKEKTDKAINKLIKQQQSLKTPDKNLQTFINVTKKFRDNVANKKNEILKKFPDLPNAMKKLNLLAEKNNQSYKMVVSIAKNEKKLYNSLYSNHLKTPNACNQFIL